MSELLLRLFIKNRQDIKDERVRTAHATLASVTGILLNLLLFIGKLIMGLISASIAVVADALNNLSDAGSSIVTMFGFRLAAKPVDKEHPLGHGRFEYITGFIVDAVIIFVGAELLISSVERLFSPTQPTAGTATFIILGASILVKLWLFFFYRKIGGRIESAALKATALDSISDCFSTSLVLFAALAGKFGWFGGFPLDGIAGILVACLILFAGIKSAKEIIDLLLGSPPSPEFIQEIYDFTATCPTIVDIQCAISLSARRRLSNLPSTRRFIHMRIALGCDHGGLMLKNALIPFIRSLGHTVEDFGTFTEESCDYPDYAAAA